MTTGQKSQLFTIDRIDEHSLAGLSEDTHPSIIAETLSPISSSAIGSLLSSIDVHLQEEIFNNFSPEKKLELAESLSVAIMSPILSLMPADDRVDLLKSLPEARANMLMRSLAQAERDDILTLSAFAEGTAGSVMTSDYTTIRPDSTADMAIANLRQVAPDKETIYYCYILDDNRNLVGFVSLKDLILAHPQALVRDIMVSDLIYAHVSDDQEKAVNLISEYDLLAIPVINDRKELVGIITHDDALDVINQEQTEDIEKLMAIGGSHKSTYLHTSSWVHFKNRAWWLSGLAIIGLISGWILHSFEHTLDKLFLLALYLPMVADTGGNSGSQSATVVIRALALNEITLQDCMQILFKELQISIMVAIVLGMIAFIKVLFLSHDANFTSSLSLETIAIAISLALGIQVVSSTLIGAILPLTAQYFKRDPALIASPALTTLVDITGLLIYFCTTKIVLGI